MLWENMKLTQEVPRDRVFSEIIGRMLNYMEDGPNLVFLDDGSTSFLNLLLCFSCFSKFSIMTTYHSFIIRTS